VNQTPKPAGAAAPSVDADNVAALHGVDFSIDGKVIFRGLDIAIRRARSPPSWGRAHRQDHAAQAHHGPAACGLGRVLVEGRDVAGLSRRELYAMRRRMGMLFQNGALLTDLDVFENVAFPLREHAQLPERLLRNIVLSKLQAVGLRGAAQLRASSCRAAWRAVGAGRGPSS